MSLQAARRSRLSLGFAVIAILLLTPAVLSAQEKIVFHSRLAFQGGQIFVMNPDGTNKIQLTSAEYFNGEPALSPSGDKIAFTSSRDGDGEIYIMNTNGTGQTNLTNNPGWDSHPSFSPDGDRIVFASMRDSHFGIWIMNVDGTNQTELLQGFGGTDPSFFPYGSKIIFSGMWGGSSEIFTMDEHGLNLTNLSQDDDAEDLHPSFSPDGTKILFTKKVHNVAGGEIMVMNADGTNLINLTNNPADDYNPSFSPNGNFITFTSTRRDGNADIWVMNADGTNPVNIIGDELNPATDETPVWGVVPNTPPILTNISVMPPINEGGRATLYGEIVDLDATDIITLDISWGDGQSISANFLPGWFGLEHVYADDQPPGSDDYYPITLTVHDQISGGTFTIPTAVRVNNVNPILSDTAVTPTSVAAGGTVTLSGNYTDPGYHGSPLDEELKAFINWGDGQSVVINTGRPETINLTHQYTAVGNYTINIKVTDNDGGLTTQNLGVVVTAPPPPPAAPTNFRILSVAANQVQLAWTDASTTENGFAIERCSGQRCNNFAEIGRVGPNTTTYVDGNVAGNTQYSYRMRAFNVGGMSSYTNVVSAKTPRR